MAHPPEYEIRLTTAHEGFDGKSFRAQARAGALPPSDGEKHPRAVLTMQKALRAGSDLYYALHSCESRDRGETWSAPREQPAFRRETTDDGNERVVCDFWPAWHAATSTLLGTGHTAYYSPENKILSGLRPRQTAYAVYDPAESVWPAWRVLEMPDGETFFNAGAGCTQRVDLENGEILLPFYFGLNPGVRGSSSTVARCAFDGETLTYLEHGDVLFTPVQRGFVEPSLCRCGERFFLSLRNDERDHLAVSDDGLHFGDPAPCRFDTGEDLESYNTQQHWIVRGETLFLVYTRKGLDNDHVFRHRAPLVMAEVDTDTLRVIRDSERILVPNRGARLGNFGVAEFDDDETWVVVAEWMQPEGCEAYGSDNAIWVARLLWR